MCSIKIKNHISIVPNVVSMSSEFILPIGSGICIWTMNMRNFYIAVTGLGPEEPSEHEKWTQFQWKQRSY